MASLANRKASAAFGYGAAFKYVNMKLIWHVGQSPMDRYRKYQYGPTTFNNLNNILACGGNFQSESGVIDFPPGDVSNYPHNLSCAYVITTSPAKVLNLTFANTFHIEGTPGACRYDWLQVLRDQRQKLMKTYY